MPNVSCRVCHKQFYAKLSWLIVGAGVYCSKDCQNLGRKTGKIISCFLCGRKVYKQKKAITRSKTQHYFCSKTCSITWHNREFKEEKHANRVYGSFSYKRILERSNLHEKCGLCGISNKKLLVAHHVDKNRKNNDVKNLMWLCYNCHHLAHNYVAVEVQSNVLNKNHADHYV